MTPEQIKQSGFDTYFVDHTAGIYPQAASGMPWSAATIQSTGDAITDLFEDLAAEQKARTTYDNLLRLVDDPDVRDPLKFLRAREIVHFQRFGEAKRSVQQRLLRCISVLRRKGTALARDCHSGTACICPDTGCIKAGEADACAPLPRLAWFNTVAARL